MVRQCHVSAVREEGVVVVGRLYNDAEDGQKERHNVGIGVWRSILVGEIFRTGGVC